MALIKDANLVSDPWEFAGDDSPVQADIPTIVSYKRFLEERETLLASQAELGVKVQPGEDITALEQDLLRLRVVALDFPKYTDGRSYSAARILRQRYGFEGEIRATGEVLRDQYLFMQRAGFDAYEVREGAEARDWLSAIGEFSYNYQHAANGSRALWTLRHPAAAAE